MRFGQLHLALALEIVVNNAVMSQSKFGISNFPKEWVIIIILLAIALRFHARMPENNISVLAKFQRYFVSCNRTFINPQSTTRIERKDLRNGVVLRLAGLSDFTQYLPLLRLYLVLYRQTKLIGFGTLSEMTCDMDGIGHGDISYIRATLGIISCGNGGISATLENIVRISDILIHDEDDNEIRQPAPVKD